MSLNNNRMLEHYVGSGVNSTPHTLPKVTREAPALDRQTNPYTCCPWTLCLYTDPEGRECLEPIDCGAAPNHFKNKHGITNMGREVKLVYNSYLPAHPSYTVGSIKDAMYLTTDIPRSIPR
ncbi:hypothetical protein EDD16DRAFT_1522022 [Pisolithus croceorrhizus]|nr:hypothetical protein EDD16DRAFT_1522022 [Pisolithus croceorrhizus]